MILLCRLLLLLYLHITLSVFIFSILFFTLLWLIINLFLDLLFLLILHFLFDIIFGISLDQLVSHKSLFWDWLIQYNSSSLEHCLIEILYCLQTHVSICKFNKCISFAHVFVRMPRNVNVFDLSKSLKKFP